MNKLYKFQSINTDNLSALLESCLYFAEPQDLNDPTEGLFDFTGFDPEDEYSKLAGKCSILSMGVDNKESNEALSKSLFHWSHYADGCKGICLIFNKESLKSNFLSRIIVDGNMNYGYPITIDKSDHIESLYEGCEEVSGFIFREQKLKEYIKRAFFNKPICFKIESEFRFTKETKGLLEYDSSSLESIVIGEKIPSNDLKLLKAVIQSLNVDIPIQKATVKLGSFKIHLINYIL